MVKPPERGDLVWLNFSPQSGHEQAGRRSALVVSKRDFNDRVGLAFVSPITSKIKGRGFEVRLPEGLDIQGAVLIEHTRSIDWTSRIEDTIGTGPQAVIDEALAKLELIFR